MLACAALTHLLESSRKMFSRCSSSFLRRQLSIRLRSPALPYPREHTPPTPVNPRSWSCPHSSRSAPPCVTKSAMVHRLAMVAKSCASLRGPAAGAWVACATRLWVHPRRRRATLPPPRSTSNGGRTADRSSIGRADSRSWSSRRSMSPRLSPVGPPSCGSTVSARCPFFCTGTRALPSW